ncbi:MAG: AAA family ATPase [Prevotellaceae bacterium]|jgi:exodeoxyribonuclease-5|nr:AAA family ATPase [Prevotellaceae bacterium]
MVNEYIINLLKNKLNYTPTALQEVLIKNLSQYIVNPDDSSIFLIRGYAGTGKTSLVAALVKVLNDLKLKSVLLAPTGRAAKVLSIYAASPTYTIHKKIYKQKSLADALSSFSLDRNMHSDTLFIVDEASMIANSSFEQSMFGSGRLLDDLIRYVKSGKRCKLIVIGDNAQLPPVGLSISPALDHHELLVYGSCSETVLSEVVRQAAGSGILYNATNIRNQIEGQDIRLPRISLANFPDIESISGAELMEKLSEAYDYYGNEETMVICRSNRRANRYNSGIRSRILFREEEIEQGDRVMVVKNNYQSLKDNELMDFIANGDIARIKRIRKYEERYGIRYVNVSLQFEDYNELEIDGKIMLDTLSIETASLPVEKNKELFFAVSEDYAHITPKKKRYNAIREDAYFNALQVKFAYAITCHKAQGGQWKCVFLDNPFFKEENISLEDLRWLYTAITRTTEKLYLVNFDKNMLIF